MFATSAVRRKKLEKDTCLKLLLEHVHCFYPVFMDLCGSIQIKNE